MTENTRKRKTGKCLHAKLSKIPMKNPAKITISVLSLVNLRRLIHR
jgi:hypothetical protein